MKIVIVQGAFLPVPPILGGATEKLWYRLALEFAAAGHEVVYFSRRHPRLPNEEITDGVRHIRLPGYDSPRSLLGLKLLDLVYTLRVCGRLPRDAGVIVSNTFWLPLLLRGRRGRRVVVDVGRAPKGQMRLYRHVGCLRGNSTPIAEAIRAELGAGGGRVAMVPNPLPFAPVPEAAAFAAKRPQVFFAGRIHPEKGVHVLLAALRLLAPEWPPGWRLVVAGPWEVGHGGGGETYWRELHRLAEGLPVEFTGPIFDPDRLNALYQGSAIFCYPSLAEKGETFGLAPLEAMAWGNVPIVSSLACFRDFIRDGENGVIFDHRAPDAAARLAAALRGLIAGETRRRQMASRAHEVNASHASRVIADEFLAEFQRLPQ